MYGWTVISELTVTIGGGEYNLLEVDANTAFNLLDVLVGVVSWYISGPTYVCYI